MKRFVLPLVCLAAVLLAGTVILQRRAPRAKQVATWLPGGTILFEDMPDLHRTAQRWPQTELAQILNEPEVQAFLSRPLGAIPNRPEVDKRLDQVRKIDPANFFLAVTEWSGNGTPKIVAGLGYSGSKTDLDALVDELRKQAQGTWPAGKSDIETYGSGEIETFTAPTFSAALAYRGQWLFVATDTALLKATLDRYDRKTGPADSLAEQVDFKKTLDHLPGAPDNVLFMRPALLADKAASLALVLNPMADMHGAESLRKVETLGVALKLDGDVARDAMYITTSEPEEPGAETPLAKDALKLSSSDTIILVSSRVHSLGSTQLPDATSDPSGMLQMFESYLKAFSDQGLGPAQFTQAFGPENGFALDWPQGAMIPAPLMMIDVKDAGTARKFMDTLTTLPLPAGVNFTRQDAGGISLYSLPATGIGFFPLQVTLGLTGKSVIGALTAEAVTQGAKRWDNPGAGLAATAAYQKAAALVAEPTMSFTYVDSKAVFERIYGLFRGVASMGLIPHLADYVDISKLPAPETISRHLGPMVASGSIKDGGVLMESAGPVTVMQAVAVTAICAGAAAVPIIEQQLSGQSVAIPGLHGLGPNPANPVFKPFTSPLTPAPSGNGQFGGGTPVPSAPAPTASPSGGTQ